MDRTLNPEMLDSSPIKQFTLWFDEAVAAGLPEPNAMVLTTVGPGRGRTRGPCCSRRTTTTGFTFYTNRTSRKGRDLAADPRCCALFPWYAPRPPGDRGGRGRPLRRRKASRTTTRGAWLSQIGAWASRQSPVLASRAELDDRVAELSARWPEGTEVPMPDFWGGYLIVPDTVEFWQSRQNRLHDRLQVPAAAAAGHRAAVA